MTASSSFSNLKLHIPQTNSSITSALALESARILDETETNITSA